MTQSGTLILSEALSALPPVPSSHQQLRTQTRSTVQNPSSPAPLLVILDDDPTGTQTCHDITILTVWDVQNLVSTFKQVGTGNGFFILTNSRALHPQQARELMIEICTNLKTASQETNLPYEIVLRGDSILRGHFPLEPEAVEHVNGPS